MNWEQTKQDLLARVAGMSHRQLMKYARAIGLRGDFMKGDNGLTATEYLRKRVHDVIADKGEHAIPNYEIILRQCFPDRLPPAATHTATAQGETSQESAEVPETIPEPATAAHKPVQAQKSQTNDDAALQIAALLAQMTAGKAASVDADQVRAIVKKELEGIVLPVTVRIQTGESEPVQLEGVFHRNFPEMLQKLDAGMNVWLVGPAGTGKTTAAEMAAKALGRKFFCDGITDNDYKLKGFRDAQGNYFPPQFRQAFETGGLYLADEIDGWLPSATLGLQSAVANGHCDFPDGIIERHKDFLMIGAANTYGLGATADYVGRARHDGAFLDRFVFQDWPIDETLERTLAGNDRWVSYVQKVRANARAKGIKVIISPRASMFGSRMLAKNIPWDTCVESVLRKGMPAEQWESVK